MLAIFTNRDAHLVKDFDSGLKFNSDKRNKTRMHLNIV